MRTLATILLASIMGFAQGPLLIAEKWICGTAHYAYMHENGAVEIRDSAIETKCVDCIGCTALKTISIDNDPICLSVNVSFVYDDGCCGWAMNHCHGSGQCTFTITSTITNNCSYAVWYIIDGLGERIVPNATYNDVDTVILECWEGSQDDTGDTTNIRILNATTGDLLNKWDLECSTCSQY